MKPVQRLEQLHALIDGDPAVVHGYLALAGLLRRAGDPRGHLIGLQHARLLRAALDQGIPLTPEMEYRGDVGTRERTLLAWLTPRHRAEGEVDGNVDLGWWCGFIDRLGLLFRRQDWRNSEVLRRLVAHPSSCHLQDLQICNLLDGPVREVGSRDTILAAITEHFPPSLRSLALRQPAEPGGWGTLDLSRLWPVARNLRSLLLGAETIELHLPEETRLERLVVQHADVAGDELAALVQRSPGLRVLEVGRLVDAHAFWRLPHRLRPLTRARSVCLMGPHLDDRAVARILDVAPLLENIEELRLPNTLGAAGDAAIRSRLPNVTFVSTLDWTGEDPDFEPAPIDYDEWIGDRKRWRP